MNSRDSHPFLKTIDSNKFRLTNVLINLDSLRSKIFMNSLIMNNRNLNYILWFLIKVVWLISRMIRKPVHLKTQ